MTMTHVNSEDQDKVDKRVKELRKRWDLINRLTKKGEGLTSSVKSLLGPMGIPDPHKIKILLEKKISGKGTALKVMTPSQMLQR